MKDHADVVGLYRYRANRLRLIAEGLADFDNADFLRTLADEFDDLASRILPKQ